MSEDAKKSAVIFVFIFVYLETYLKLLTDTFLFGWMFVFKCQYGNIHEKEEVLT